MKYGILAHIGFAKEGESNRRILSLGDVFECVAILDIYKEMGIDENELVSCYQYNLNSYEGEYVVVPVNIYSLNLNYSKRILPVFLGLTYGGNHGFSDYELKMLRRFEPIGCRDERTMRNLLNEGIDAYLQGCLVASFDEREQNLPTQKKVFFVNPNAGIKDYIPEELFDNYEFFSHDFYVNPEEEFGNGEHDIYEYGRRAIEKYAKEARLIVTSKYHAALIALALGIPVILLMENNYYKYSWIEKYIPIYEPKDFKNINWNPDPIVIPKEEKDLMKRIAKNRIKATYDKYEDICTLSEIRENTNIKEFKDIFYGNFAIEYIKDHWNKDEKIEYAFWGATDTAKKLNEYIVENYPLAHLKKVYDYTVRNEIEYAEGCYVPCPLDEIETDEGMQTFIIVTGNSASEAAHDLFAKMGKKNYFLCERKELTEEDI